MVAENCDIMAVFRETLPVFSVLSDEIRQQIILILAEAPDGMNVTDITEKTALSRPAVSHHLKILKQAQLVDFNKSGKENFYFLTLKICVESLKKLTSMIEESCELK